jgi:diguanylate cyclase (GGDEF)-like protein
LIYLDLDRFKIINDSLGHGCGDELLREVARRLERRIREGDTVARLGGDEFVLLLMEIGAGEEAARVAETLLETLRQPFAIRGRELYVSASLGVCVYPHDGSDPESLIKNADSAMYRAKEQGRNCFQLYAPAMNFNALERLALEHGLRQALQREQLVLVYQPVWQVADASVVGMEALLRWSHPELGRLQPKSFIALAELTGQIVPIGRWVLERACAQARRWQLAGHPLIVSVNVSTLELQQPDCAQAIARILERAGIAPSSIELELTESQAMQDAAGTLSALRRLKELGLRIAIDDFGVGHSSLSYLSRLPIDTLKIDMSFVQTLQQDAGNAAIVKTVIALARNLGLTVVAEGVESGSQLAFLRQHGCDRMQGNLLAAAQPAEQIEPLLALSVPVAGV